MPGRPDPAGVASPRTAGRRAAPGADMTTGQARTLRGARARRAITVISIAALASTWLPALDAATHAAAADTVPVSQQAGDHLLTWGGNTRGERGNGTTDPVAGASAVSGAEWVEIAGHYGSSAG